MRGVCRLLPLLAALCAQPVPEAGAQTPSVPRSPGELTAQAIRIEHGEGVARNFGKAAELYCAAADAGDAEAAYRLGWMYANGRGLERDDGIAVALFRRAAAQGHAYAERMLRLISSDDIRLPECIAGRAIAKTGPAEPASASVQSPDPDEKQNVAMAIANWLSAWSGKDVHAYLDAYAKDFAPSAGMSRHQWEEERRSRIAGPTWISVKVVALEISIHGNTASARFQQDYRSDRYKERSFKTLDLVRIDGSWLIRQERSGE